MSAELFATVISHGISLAIATFFILYGAGKIGKPPVDLKNDKKRRFIRIGGMVMIVAKLFQISLQIFQKFIQ
jgi:hypothetical protein